MERFKTINGVLYINKEYKTKRLKELTAEKNEIEHQINLQKKKLRNVEHWLKVTKKIKTMPKNLTNDDNKNY